MVLQLAIGDRGDECSIVRHPAWQRSDAAAADRTRPVGADASPEHGGKAQEVVIGRPRSTTEFGDTLVSKKLALPGDARRIERDWEREGIELPLEIVEAPYRDLGDPLRRYLRALTADPELAVSVVMPELVLAGWRELLHHQRALYVKRLLLFEPRVLLTSVPYRLP